jgi:hypothetical protein
LAAIETHHERGPAQAATNRVRRLTIVAQDPSVRRDGRILTAEVTPSTMPGVHGRSEAIAVPRGPLVEALARRMTVVRTDSLVQGVDSVAVAAPCHGPEPFAERPVTSSDTPAAVQP